MERVLFDAHSTVLRNLLGVDDAQILANAENDLVEYRIAEFREQPGLVQGTYNSRRPARAKRVAESTRKNHSHPGPAHASPGYFV